MSIPTQLELEQYLHTNIPISEAMGVRIVSASPKQVSVSALFEKNFNHKCTVFGGSLHAVAALACWSLLYYNLSEKTGRYEIVIANSEVSYSKPVNEDFTATCEACSSTDWDRFIRTLERKGKSRVKLVATIGDPKDPAVQFNGTFVAISMGSQKGE